MDRLTTKKTSYPLCVSAWGDEEISAMTTVIKSGVFTMGPLVKKFERQFAKFVGSKYACMVNSGSSANLLAIAALFVRKDNRLKRGDEVIVSAVSWSTTYAPLQQFGLHVKFVDVDPDTLNICPKSLARNISEKTKLVLGVNLLGNPVDIDQTLSIISRQTIPPIFLEDNCESMGAAYKGKQMGTHGLLGTFSTFYSHHMSTMEGGLVVTDDKELYHVLLSLRAHGWTRDLPTTNLLDAEKNKDPFYNSYNFVLPGYNVRPGELHAAIGLQQLVKLPDFIAQRRRNAQEFTGICRKFGKYFTCQAETEASSWFSFALVCKIGIERDPIIQALTKAGIETRPIVAGNFTKNSVISFFDYSIGEEGLEHADFLHTNGFTIGNHHIPMRCMFECFENTLTEYFGVQHDV